MPNNDYVKREDIFPAVMEIAKEIVFGNQDDDKVVDIINSIPAADVEPKKKWISVDDRLPQDHEMVLCYTPVDDYICVGFVCKYEWGSKTLLKWKIITAMRSTKILTKKVTHWMSLPDAPKEEA